MSKVQEFQQKCHHRNFLLQYIATFTANLTAVSSGMHFGWPTPSLPQLLDKESLIPTTSSNGSWIAIVSCIGSPPGAILGALVVDKIGRKTCMLIVSPVYFISWLAIAYAQSLLALIIARFIVGVMDGILFTVLPMYLGEISDRRIRGRLGSSLTVSFLLGSLLINVFGLHWSIKTTALVASIVPVLHFVSFISMPESPYYYLLKGDNSKAVSSYKKFTRAKNAEEEVNKLISHNNNVSAEGSSKYLNLFLKKGNRKALVIVLGLRFVQQFSGYYTIAFYCLIIFNQAGGSISGRTATLIYFTVQLIASVASSSLVDRIGRKPLLIVSVIGAGFSLTALGIYFYLKQEIVSNNPMLGYIPTISLLLYNILFNFGLSTIPILVLGEFFPTDVKAFALCVIDTFYGLFIILASKFFQIVNDRFGMHVSFLTFAICCAAGLIFIVFCVPETKGKTLEQIQRELSGENLISNTIREIPLNDAEKT